MKNISTVELVRLLGTPFSQSPSTYPGDDLLLDIYDRAFEDRVALLYLSLFRHEGWNARLEEKYRVLKAREEQTLIVLSDLAENLNEIVPNKYVIIKSIKPYPATPNDTDVLILGDHKDFEQVLNQLYARDYVFHEWAPMQTTLYDPRGKGKVGKGKKGGTYYIDIYEDISTDYVCYLNKQAIIPNIYEKVIHNKKVRLLGPEVELAIILFHNMFPERSYQLEHFYMPLYYLSNPSFNSDLFVNFSRSNHLDYAIRSNLSLISGLHERCFGFTPAIVSDLLKRLGSNDRELQIFSAKDMQTPYMFSPTSFFATILYKGADMAFLKSLMSQAIHMLNPVFFWDVMQSLKNRLSERGTYHLE